MNSGERSILGKRISRRGLIFGGATLAVGLTAAAIVGCESKDGQKANVAKSPTPEPTKEPTPTPVPTKEPTPTPEGLSDQEIAEFTLKMESTVHIVNSVADLFPESEVLSTVRVNAQNAATKYSDVLKTKDYQSIRPLLEDFANVGVNIGNFACNNTYGEVEGNAWAEVKDLVLNSSLKFEELGYLEVGTTQTFKDVFFRVPESCTNQIMLSSQ